MKRFVIAAAALLFSAWTVAASAAVLSYHPPVPTPVVVVQQPVVDLVELDALARVTYCEARGEGELGMRAVAHVAVNRTHDGRWSSDLQDVLSQPAQFSCWPVLDRIRYEGVAWEQAKAEALSALLGQSSDPTGGATHYHATYVHPRWAARSTRLEQIGRHIFYA